MGELGDDAEAGKQPDSRGGRKNDAVESRRVFGHQETEATVDSLFEFQPQNKNSV